MLKSQVETILKEIPETRNSDIRLMIEIWKRYYPQRIRANPQGIEFLRLSSLYDLPTHESIKRWRAKFNEKGKYLPTSPEVRKARGVKEGQTKLDLGYNNLQEKYRKQFTDKQQETMYALFKK